MSDVPRIFHSVEFDGPFSKCLNCEGKFDEMAVPHIISKTFRGPECIFEYCLCQSCHLEMVQSFSEESRQNLESFHNESVDLEKRSDELAESEHHTDWLKTCLTCQTPVQQLKDYSIAALVFDSGMIFDPFPRMMCGICEMKMQEKLSAETRDQWDRFVRDNFEGPPAEALTPDGRIPVLA
ncbi:hypothetical protein N9085_01005 [Akkermansiaceae bacterium]|nr:hypothetical protein [Akkermansiaceae bacterium]MDB4440323.1 hypothetical protein [bacterium]MDB4313987.1 hypothetical protein [Akkermansiaceae bacterium]MDB4356648.1 hypothetical protein [Akkermansiaceae bacterium]MDB4373999.1 hypothetical protein [Akkermansiaceae bacterium]